MKMILKYWTGNARKPVTKLYSDRTRRFSSSVVPNSIKKAYVKVSYGNKECNFGCICEFANWGEYETKAELIKAIRMFTEDL